MAENQIVETRALLKNVYEQVKHHLGQAGDYSGGFREINNKVMICNKIFDSKDIRFSSNNEGLEAIKLVLRDFLFVPTISAFEYNLLRILPHKKAPITSSRVGKKSIRTIKFSNLVNWLSEDNLIRDQALWQFALNDRNDIVHFDAHARSTLVSPDPDIKVTANENEVIRGELISFVKLTQKLETEYYNLICKIKSR